MWEPFKARRTRRKNRRIEDWKSLTKEKGERNFRRYRSFNTTETARFNTNSSSETAPQQYFDIFDQFKPDSLRMNKKNIWGRNIPRLSIPRLSMNNAFSWQLHHFWHLHWSLRQLITSYIYSTTLQIPVSVKNQSFLSEQRIIYRLLGNYDNWKKRRTYSNNRLANNRFLNVVLKTRGKKTKKKFLSQSIGL